MENVPFPLEEVVEHLAGEAHHPHEYAHREHTRKIPGHVDFALVLDLADHFVEHLTDHRLHHPGDRRRPEELG